MSATTISLPVQHARHELIGLALITLVVTGIYAETTLSMIDTWAGSEAFAHGFLVFPICVLLAWRAHADSDRASANPTFIGAFISFGLSVAWWLAEVVGVQVIKQLTLVAMVPAIAMALFGKDTVRRYAFALSYLVFSVPFGEFLLPHLIDFTAWFTVETLNLFGIPVFRDGPYFSTPAGSFEVAKACAGLKYLIATLALTVLFSHFLFERVTKALLFVSTATVLSIVANAIRATTVVLLLQFTDLDIAAGTDHEFVGWLIYALLAIGIVWTGLRLQDNNHDTSVNLSQANTPASIETPWPEAAMVRAGGLAALAIMVGPVLSWSMSHGDAAGSGSGLGLPGSIDGWIGGRFEAKDWYPDFRSAGQSVAATYTREGYQIDVVVLRLDNVRQGVELSNTANSVADETQWYVHNSGQVTTSINDLLEATLVEDVAKRADATRLIWSLMLVDGALVDNQLEVRLQEAAARLRGRPILSSAVILSTPISETQEVSRGLLAEFVTAGYPEISHCLEPGLWSTNCTLGIDQEGTD